MAQPSLKQTQNADIHSNVEDNVNVINLIYLRWQNSFPAIQMPENADKINSLLRLMLSLEF